ncbi:DEAD-box ATP-dependent RNA helicase 35A-like [Ananas comosus]|uniref:DEAD-box ATP-dependent RNA helicase 35A-like n=1 Tax=Ananas comosus TaxID=4615 RepID=A0A6P5G3R7_ANACO|nr:DEAD-box ATP-dependent RNA helicase 35A-like [Ananas comosus]
MWEREVAAKAKVSRHRRRISFLAGAGHDDGGDDDDYEEYVPVHKRRALEAQKLLFLHHRAQIPSIRPASPRFPTSALRITYSDPLPRGWKPCPPLLHAPARAADLRRCWHISSYRDDVPPPIPLFRDMRLPDPVLRKLREKGIVRPTPIQVQGLPVVLSGRDMIGIAFTSFGKTLVFVLPLIMAALEEELIMPVVPGEGPFGLVVYLSCELARQSFEVVEQFLAPLRDHGFPETRPLLCIGGEPSPAPPPPDIFAIHHVWRDVYPNNPSIKKNPV